MTLSDAARVAMVAAHWWALWVCCDARREAAATAEAARRWLRRALVGGGPSVGRPKPARSTS
jgi:hypothetical protein